MAEVGGLWREVRVELGDGSEAVVIDGLLADEAELIEEALSRELTRTR